MAPPQPKVIYSIIAYNEGLSSVSIYVTKNNLWLLKSVGDIQSGYCFPAGYLGVRLVNAAMAKCRVSQPYRGIGGAKSRESRPERWLIY